MLPIYRLHGWKDFKLLPIFLNSRFVSQVVVKISFGRKDLEMWDAMLFNTIAHCKS